MKAEIDSARESYSSSPPLEDCILPLLPESMRETESKKRKDVREREIDMQRDLVYLQRPIKKQSRARREIEKSFWKKRAFRKYPCRLKGSDLERSRTVVLLLCLRVKKIRE